MFLTKDENRLVRELWTLRDKVAKRKPKHGSDGWHHDERRRGREIVAWLKEDEVALQKAARRLPGGWRRRHRAQRFQIVHLTRIRDPRGHPKVWDQTGTLRERALKIARSQVGVMEHGGNNMGARVFTYIRENGGFGPEPWCGDFQAFCYRHAGSKSVDRRWASAWFLEGRKISNPQPGDIVDYTFQHTGMVEKVLGDGRIQTIEGNTGASGAVSDSTTGGDGVYRKRRSTSLVMRYVRVLR